MKIVTAFKNKDGEELLRVDLQGPSTLVESVLKSARGELSKLNREQNAGITEVNLE